MKKRIVFLTCVFAMSAMAAEPTCNGGSTITSHKATDEGCDLKTCNEHTFCKSNKDMNWWSAFAWCESQNRKLADFTTMCPNVSQSASNISGDCPNLHGVGGDVGLWSSLASDKWNAFLVNSSSGAIFTGSRNSPAVRRAFCE